MAFPTTPILDDFNRADGPIGANWDCPRYAAYCPEILSSVASAATTLPDSSSDAIWNVSTFLADQEVHLIATKRPTADATDIILMVRENGVDFTGATFEKNDLAGDKVIIGANSFFFDWNDGDGIGVRAVGQTITVYYQPGGAGSWITLGSETNPAFINMPGAIGFNISPGAKVDDFGGGDYVAPPTPGIVGADTCVECARLSNPFAPPAELDWYISPDGQTYQFDNAMDDILLAFQGYGMPGIDYISQQGPFQHGKTLLDYRLQPRIIQLEHRRQACDRYDYWSNRGGLLNLLRPNRQYANQFDLGKLRKILPGNVRRDIDVLVQQGPQFAARNDGGDWIDFTDTIQFIAPDPTFYDPDTVIVMWTIKVTDELFFYSAAFPDDLFFPCSFGTDVLTGTASIHYTGTWLAYPTLILTGPLNQPTIENTTTGEKIQLLYYIGVGEIVTVDLTFGNKSVTNNFGANLIGTVSTDSDLATFHIAPEPEAAWCGVHPRPCGVNNFSVNGAGGVAGLTAIEMRYYTRFIGI